MRRGGEEGERGSGGRMRKRDEEGEEEEGRGNR